MLAQEVTQCFPENKSGFLSLNLQITESAAIERSNEITVQLDIVMDEINDRSINWLEIENIHNSGRIFL